MLWKNAHQQNPNPKVDPSKCGWILQDGQYRIFWFDGDQMPKDIAQNVSAIDEEEPSEDEDDYGQVRFR